MWLYAFCICFVGTWVAMCVFVQGWDGAKQELSIHHPWPSFDQRAQDPTESCAHLHHGG